ncbi:MAG TPA: OmpA family protein [Tepidisphaeraceae bacterium]|nr:OmpA family protein [Tepidisphaeraceae bacterium]
MSSFRMGSLILMLGSALVVGCSGKNTDELSQLRKQNQELQTRLTDAEGKLRSAPDATQLQALQNEISQREARIKDLESQLQKGDATNGNDPQLAGIKATYDRAKGELTVQLPGDVLFAPGSADLKSTAKATLDKIAAAIKKEYADKKVRVEGHTDTDPIRASGKQWTDNLDLSLNRAAAVTRYLEAQGINKKLVGTVGYGEHHPKASKAASRRVEIIVVVG